MSRKGKGIKRPHSSTRRVSWTSCRSKSLILIQYFHLRHNSSHSIHTLKDTVSPQTLRVNLTKWQTPQSLTSTSNVEVRPLAPSPTHDDKITPLPATIETSYPLFIIHTNHVTTLPDTSLYTLCQQIYTTALNNLALPEFIPLPDLLTAIFDPSHRAFVLPTSPSTLPLSEDARGCVFAQAIAGMIAFLRPAATLKTGDGVRAALRRFGESEERRRILTGVEAWPRWGDCFEKAQIGGMIMAVVGVEPGTEAAGGEKEVGGDVSVVEMDEVDEAPVLFHDGPHLSREFGVPDRFQIMALN